MRKAARNNYVAIRDRQVIKANDLIQKSRFSLTVFQQKLVLYLISQINQFDDDFKLYEFSIRDFCRTCGIDADNGGNYALIKEQIQTIRNKSLWITLPDGRETLVAWIEKPYINPKSGIIQIRLDADMKPYLLKLKDNFTRYELRYTLKFRSKYSIRLYELIKSIHYHDLEPYERYYSLEELRRLIGAEKYTTWQHLKEKALNVAISEINQFSDKTVEYTPIKSGRAITGIKLKIKSKDVVERLKICSAIDADMGYDPNQYSLFDGENGSDETNS